MEQTHTPIPRPEYPRPQLGRDAFLNLNGPWEFSFDFSNSGKARNYQLEPHFDRTITVPFCPESVLSGIGFTDFIPAVWYKRSFTLPEEALKGRVLLHFGAVDYRCTVWVNDVECGGHQGGYTPFTLDVTDAAKAGENKVVLWAEDDVRSQKQPGGKQCSEFRSYGCNYTRTTGIWQTVWVEWVPASYIASYRVIPDRRNSKITLKIAVEGCTKDAVLTAAAFFDGKEAGTAAAAAGPCTMLELPLSVTELWEPGHPALYDLKLTLSGPNGADEITGYFGLRDVEVRAKRLYINGKPVYQRLVLDQGFYPDGIYTAPSDEAMKADITRCQDLGFNGARLHQKVFEPRFLYWADHLGYLCWGEYPSWDLDLTRSEALGIFLPEWLESVDRDFNHPAIIGWCPLNETWPGDLLNTTQVIYQVTKRADPTRPVIDTSGYCHWGKTDIYDVHDYEQDPAVFAEHYAHLSDGVCFVMDEHRNLKTNAWDGKTPVFVSEYGGTWWNPDVSDGWGYGQQPKSEEEVCDRYCGLTRALLENPRICAFCYTQPYDVEQEQNGLFHYDRSPKFSEETYRRIRETNLSPAAMEQE